MGIDTVCGSNELCQLGLIVMLIAGILQLIWAVSGIFFVISMKYAGLLNFFRNVLRLLKVFFSGVYNGAWEKVLHKYIYFTGFLYDREQDIFYSAVDAWQRQYGYCRLYDESSALAGMIVDCEPVCFTYNGKRWLIEFWKGQYDLTTGFEVGIYNTDQPEMSIPGVFDGTFYNSAKDDEMLNMSCVLFKNGEKLFQREDKHWWLTGFKVGEFSNPSELVLHVSIEFLDTDMQNAFVMALISLQYPMAAIGVTGNTVNFVFDKPHSLQPYTRTSEIESITQWKNKYLCDIYNELTKDLKNTPKKIHGVRRNEPDLFQNILDLGKSKKTFEVYQSLEPYLN